MDKTLLKISLFFAATILLASCSISKMASDITAGIMVGGSPIVEQESDPLVAEHQAKSPPFSI